MNAVAEGEVGIGFAADVEPLGILEGLGIAIGRIHEGKDALPLANRPAAHLDVCPRDAGKGARGAVVAQELLDGAFGQAGV